MSKGAATCWIRRMHTWLGLLNFSILCVFGVAGLVVTFETPDIFQQKQGPAVRDMAFTPAPGASDRDVAAQLRNVLAQSQPGPPLVRRNASNQLVADFYSINGLVRATLLTGERQVRVETFRNSIWRYLDNAHATTISEQTGDAKVRIWAWYIELAIWSSIAMGLSGLWLGLASRWSYRWTPVALTAGSVVFLALVWMER